MKICFVALNVYPCLAKKNDIWTIGGAEVQQIYIGRELRNKGYDVSFISLDYGQREEHIIEDFTISKSFKPEDGIFGIRFFYPRLVKIWKALRKANADIYYVRCASFLTGILALFCRIYKRKFIFAAGHDTDFIPHKYRFKTIRDRVLYEFGLRRADSIIVQSAFQKKMLKKNFRKNSIIIRNFDPNNGRLLHNIEKKYILWVSTIRTWKRPFKFIRLAKRFPEEKFVMIGGPDKIDEALFYQVKREAENFGNLQFMGFLPLEETEKYFDKCKVFINTSEYEGFPNTFLQAWRRGIPVISYVDPDNIIRENKLGFAVGSEEELKEALASLITNTSKVNDHIIKYFKKNHSSKSIEQYRELLKKVYFMDLLEFSNQNK
jgi:glycosyltransferase involved in cell wall biosynthesis